MEKGGNMVNADSDAPDQTAHLQSDLEIHSQSSMYI